MTTDSSLLPKVGIPAAFILTGLLISACVEPHRSSPQQVESSRPTVTYKYRNDNELIQANQRAVTFCDQYQSVPRTANISNGPDGDREVVFECTSTSPTMGPYNSNLSYDYQTDQELLDASRNAEIYCRNNGSQQATSNITSHSNGTRTITFRCGPR
jgi:hypothetical protein